MRQALTARCTPVSCSGASSGTVTSIRNLATRGQEALTLRDAVRLALRENKGIAAAEAGVRASGERVTQARSGALPKVTYAQSYTRSDNPVFVFSSLLTQHEFSAANFAIDS